MTESERTTFERSIEQTLEIVKKESPISVSAISSVSKIDSRAILRALDFLIDLQDEFAKSVVKITRGRSGSIVWIKDRIDKTKLPEHIRSWYIQRRFFEDKCRPALSTEKFGEMFTDERRTSIEVAVSRVFKALEIEDDITIAELARRTKTNRKTVERAIALIMEFQDQIAEGHVSRKELVIWRKRPHLHELDETSLRYILSRWFCPDETDELKDEKERELLLLA